MVVLNDLKNLKQQVHQLKLHYIGGAFAHGIGAVGETLLYSTVIPLVPPFTFPMWMPNEYSACHNARLAAQRLAIAEANINEAIYFLEEVESIYQDMNMGRHSQKHRTAHFEKNLAEVLNHSDNYAQTIEKIHNLNTQGMDNLLARCPLQRKILYVSDPSQSSREFVYYIAPHYLTLIKTFIVQKNRQDYIPLITQIGQSNPSPQIGHPFGL